MLRIKKPNAEELKQSIVTQTLVGYMFLGLMFAFMIMAFFSGYTILWIFMFVFMVFGLIMALSQKLDRLRLQILE